MAFWRATVSFSQIHDFKQVIFRENLGLKCLDTLRYGS
jgi:hypothetical protein